MHEEHDMHTHARVMHAHGDLVAMAILGSLLCACLPPFPEGELDGGSTDGDETESEGSQSEEPPSDETQGPCTPGEAICAEGDLQACNDGAWEMSSCEDVCAQDGRISNGCIGDECACEDRPHAGVWEGTTGAGYPLLFALSEEGRLLGFLTLVDVDTSSGCTGEGGLTARETTLVEDGAFEVLASLVGGNTPTSITGEFMSPSSANGYIDGFSGDYVLICGDSLELGSGNVFYGTGWSATPCPDCSMECPFQDDGYCDEPEGTGICFDGMDPADC
jgi:hypothetical protein